MMKLFNEKIVNRIREALADSRQVKEVKMFGGICFMVNNKMCVCASGNEMMCRISPGVYEEALERNGCRPMIHGGRLMKGFVYVDEESMKSKKDFQYWIKLALDFNKVAKPSAKKRS
ncbi:MAG: TfoX/Sxy family protein [Bacteroidota bacterium]